MSDLKVGSSAAVGASTLGPPSTGNTAVAASDPQASVAATRTGSQPTSAAPAAVATPLVQTSALDAGEQPVDIDRVATIRSAIASGHYPLVPAQIGDAMIAAGILLRSGTA